MGDYAELRDRFGAKVPAGSSLADRYAKMAIPVLCQNFQGTQGTCDVNETEEKTMCARGHYSEGKTARVRAATNEAVAKMMVDRPATEEGSECSIQLPLDEEIRIIESEIGSSRGIRIRGFGSSVVKEPKKRGPMESVQINPQMAARIERQDARIAELEARQKAELEAMEARQKAEIEAMEARQKANDEAMEARVRDLVSSMMANLPTGGGRPREAKAISLSFLQRLISGKKFTSPADQLCRWFSFAEIRAAIHNFSHAFIIGKGGFGKVFKGIIDNGATMVAIKRLDPKSKQGGQGLFN
ncbi:hypothetical protein LguiB_026738 [Lonicera macranthoides]